MNTIVYRTLSSLCDELGYSARALYTASNSIDKHYYKRELIKTNGEVRVLHIPDEFLKGIQRSITVNLLNKEEISTYATAYQTGRSTKTNAELHVGAEVLLKMDIRKFFDHITYPMIKGKVFTAEKYSDSIRILLSVLCVYSHIAPQGAPTSPAISNIILRDFDYRIGKWCDERNITYTRYCDDMTFSGIFNSNEVKDFVKEELFKEGFFINCKKTKVFHNGQRKIVTGLVVNERISIADNYKKKIRQEIYYCGKYGTEEHLKKQCSDYSEESYKLNLMGRINYVLSVEPKNEEFISYKNYLINKAVVK